MVLSPGPDIGGARAKDLRTVTETSSTRRVARPQVHGMKRVSGLHVVVSGLAEEEEEPLPPKNGTPGNGAPSRSPLDRSRLTRLLKERRYEDALEMLLKARSQSPDDPTISRSVRLLKDKLTIKYSEAVGSLDHVAQCTIPDAALSSLTLSFEERGVLALVDGIATFGDIVDASPHGKFATYRALATFLEKGILARSGKDTTQIPTSVVAHRTSRPKLSPVARPQTTPTPAPPRAQARPPEAEVEPELDFEFRPIEDDPPSPERSPRAAPAPEPVRRAPTRFADVTPPATELTPPMAAEALLDSGPPVPEDPASIRQTWDDDIEEKEYVHDRREDTQPMFQMAALVSAGAMPSTLAPTPAPPAATAALALPPAEQVPAPEVAEAAAPVPSRAGVDYDALFERATRAYVRRSYDEAMTLFEEYLARRPDDRRALHNLEQLRKRRKGS